MVKHCWSLTVRWLHLGLAVSVTLQLFLSLVMEEPGEAQGWQAWAFVAHEVFGLTAFSFAILHWLWIMSGHDGGWRHLFPLAPSSWNRVWNDARGLMRLHLPEGGAEPGLPGLVEGLGLCLVTVQGGVGFAIFILLPPEGELPEMFEWLAELHEVLGGWVWGYWFAHGGMALVHRLAGDDVLRRISPFSGSRADG